MYPYPVVSHSHDGFQQHDLPASKWSSASPPGMPSWLFFVVSGAPLSPTSLCWVRLSIVSDEVPLRNSIVFVRNACSYQAPERLEVFDDAERERPQSENRPQTSTVNQGKQISRTELDALDSSDVTRVFNPNLLREAIVSDRVTSRVDGFRHRGCRGCCFAVLVGAVDAQNPLRVEGFRNEVASEVVLVRP